MQHGRSRVPLAATERGERMDSATHQRHAPRRVFSSSLMVRALAAGSVAVMGVLTAGLPASAATHTSAVTDPAGDAVFGAPSFMDVVTASVTKSGQTFSFRMGVAGSIPASPPPTPPGTNAVYWSWPLDTDPTTFPAGYPLAQGQAGGAELILSVAWEGGSFSALLVDRRPLLTGSQAVITPIPFSISGAALRIDVTSAALGNPPGFGWGAVTFYWSSSPGAGGGHFIDVLEPFYNPSPS
jgi:hypothetical protein